MATVALHKPSSARAKGSGQFSQEYDRYVSRGLFLVRVVVGVDGGESRPQTLLLFRRSGGRGDRNYPILNWQRYLRVFLQVSIPGRMFGGPAKRGHDGKAVTVFDVEQGCCSRLATPASGSGKEQHRRLTQLGEESATAYTIDDFVDFAEKLDDASSQRGRSAS